MWTVIDFQELATAQVVLACVASSEIVFLTSKSSVRTSFQKKMKCDQQGCWPQARPRHGSAPLPSTTQLLDTSTRRRLADVFLAHPKYDPAIDGELAKQEIADRE